MRITIALIILTISLCLLRKPEIIIHHGFHIEKGYVVSNCDTAYIENNEIINVVVTKTNK